MLDRSALTPAVVLGLLSLAGLAVPHVTSDLYHLDVATRVVQGLVMVGGVRLVLSMGQLNLAHVSFACLGAYVSAALVMKAGASFWVGLVAAGTIAGLAAAAVGAVTLRLAGAYFFLVTFAFQQLVQLFFESFFEDWFGGASGLIGVPQPPAFAGKLGMYHLALALWLVTAILLVRLEYSRFGRVAEAIRQNEHLAASLGIDTFRYKLLGFVVASVTAGLIGSFFAHYQTVVHPTNFDVNAMLRLIVFVVIGGASTIWGAYAGAISMSVISELLRGFQHFETLLYGLVLILAMRFFPAGLAGAYARLVPLSKRDRAPAAREPALARE